MKLLKELIHPELSHREGRVLRRQAARGIVLRDDKLLLLFTERYNDFSLPGGGVDPDEDIQVALKRELAAVRMESYEIANGMRPVWVSVTEAMRHNRQVMSRQEQTMGQSIQRETFMLEKIAQDFLSQ
ncbi:MAG: DNA mismatch repair protein MutT [Acinetobacter sp.]|nr:DNA mismatch repair protein MutT [Acinetobacter sp.]MDO9622051.1 NUDIX domain-containing protein [Moraxellaceae bacterium]